MSVFIGTLSAAIGGGLAGLLALGAVLWLAPAPRRRPPQTEVFTEPRRLVFRRGYLTEHSDNVGFLLPDPVDHLTAWDDLIDTLSDVADGVGPAFRDLRDAGRPLRLEGRVGRDRIIVLGVRDGEDIRITVAAADVGQSSVRLDIAGLDALESEIRMLSRAHDTAPALSWICDDAGRITWANTTYTDLLIRCHGPDAACGWPMISLFPDEGGAPAGTSRRKVVDRLGTAHWFEVTTLPADDDGLRYAHAVSMAAAIRAEDGRRTFIQTLTKTFAFLPTGLAIFDKDGQLAQFNPALMDMTRLDPQWLSRRPRLTDFFDALREQQRLPEPRNYKAWRDGIAQHGRGEEAKPYRETWTLPSGPTYRMTARTQSDGAVTLLFEDVSADVSAARTAKEELNLLSAILEGADEAILAFDADGTRRTDNAAARDLWLDDDVDMLPDTLEGCIALWQGACHPSPAWGDLRSFARQSSDRAEWTDRLTRPGGTTLDMRVTPLSDNRLSVAFLRRPGVLSMAAAPVRSSHAAE
ncbi:MAG: PAS-domain containing protein [Pseudomonadota bacterium]